MNEARRTKRGTHERQNAAGPGELCFMNTTYENRSGQIPLFYFEFLFGWISRQLHVYIFLSPLIPTLCTLITRRTGKRTDIYSFYTRTRRVELYVDSKRERKKKLHFHSRRVYSYTNRGSFISVRRIGVSFVCLHSVVSLIRLSLISPVPTRSTAL